MKRKPKREGSPAVCSGCHNLIDIDKVVEAVADGREYKHGCGRVLVKGKR